MQVVVSFKVFTGLCESCQHVNLVPSSSGSTYLQCRLSFEESRFPRYPSLPVFSCSGYTARPHDNA
jgi:hypothetical protein